MVSSRTRAIHSRIASTDVQDCRLDDSRDARWNNTIVIQNDPIAEVRRLKAQPGQDIVQYGFGELSYALMGQAHSLSRLLGRTLRAALRIEERQHGRGQDRRGANLVVG
jgi:hypothetical protein